MSDESSKAQSLAATASSLARHPDSIRPTYEMPDVESGVCSAIVASQGSGALPMGKPPAAAIGTIEKNFGAVQNNERGGAGETWQDLAPIQFVTNFEEASVASYSPRKTIPLIKNGHVPVRSKRIIIGSLGGYVDAAFPSEARAGIVFPSRTLRRVHY